MRERPILFSAPMVRAVLEGRKTVTRRIVKPMRGEQSTWLSPAGIAGSPSVAIATTNPEGRFGAQLEHPRGGPLGWIECPYGQPGDRLWGRETHRPAVAHSHGMDACDCADVNVEYAADGAVQFFSDGDIEAASPGWCMPKAAQRGGYVPAIHMPRWASRITLEVTGVRVERLQAITEDQARMEGCAPAWLDADDNETVHAHAPPTYRQGFARLWRDINGPGSWDANPWVWAIAFRRVDKEQRNG